MSISLDDHERRIKDFEGKIVEIGDRIDNVVASAKDWVLHTTSTGRLSGRTVIYSIPTNLANGYDFVVISGGRAYSPPEGMLSSVEIIVNKNSYEAKGGKIGKSDGITNCKIVYTKSGSTIVGTVTGYHGFDGNDFTIYKDPITILFYK